MSIETVTFIIVYSCALVSAWLITYAIHSTLIIGGIWIISGNRKADFRVRELGWKVALVGGAVSTTFILALGAEPLAGKYATGSIIENLIWQDLPRSVPEHVRDSGHTGFGSRLEGATTLLRYVPVIAVLIWVSYALLVLARVVALTIRARELLGPRVDPPDDFRRGAHTLARAMGLRRMPIVTMSKDLTSPVALGRAEIAVPVKVVDELRPDEQRSVLAHELAHIIRRDPWWLLVAATMESMFFFQMFNRVARMKWQEQSEYLCDDMAARHQGTPVPLARALVRVAEWIGGDPPHLMAPALAEQPSILVRRIQVLLSGSKPASKFNKLPFAVAFSFLVLAVTAFAPAVGPGSVRGWGTPAFHWAGVVHAGQTIEIQGVMGGVLAQPTTGDSVFVVATRHGKASSPDVRFATVRSATGVTICALYPVPRGVAENTCEPGAPVTYNTRANDVEIEFVVYVPNGVSFAANTAVGDIRTGLLSAPVRTSTSAGSIRITTTSYASAHTSSGDVSVTMGATDWTGEIAITSKSGNIRVSLPRSADLTLSAESRTGRIKSEFAMQTAQPTGLTRLKLRGSLGDSDQATIGRGGRDLVLSSVSGSIIIQAH